MEIAEEYKEDTAAWRLAAATLRSPFWDWAYYKTPPDDVIKKETIEITTPKGVETVKNPLYSYEFHPIDPSFESPYDTDQATVRWPDQSNPRQSQPQKIDE